MKIGARLLRVMRLAFDKDKQFGRSGKALSCIILLNRVAVVLPCRTASRMLAADVSMLKPLCRGRTCQLPDNQLFAYVVRSGFPNGPFRRLRRPVLHCETARLAVQSGIGVKAVAGVSSYGCVFCCWLQGAA